ncbi:tetratricopeptide repeat protein [Candidatus Pacearchaeota archaeon]|nr:tetratricopeptide repeat protein [Candidatus Pacearchaeota archaeon]
MLRKIVKSGLTALLSLSSGCLVETGYYAPSQHNNAQNEFFAANYWSDLNKDGLVDFPNEIIGKKNNFSTGEYVTLMSRIVNQIGSELYLRLYDGKERFDGKERLIRIENHGTIPNNDWFTWLTYYPGRLTPGKYTGKWFLNDFEIGNTTINVTDKNKQLQKPPKTIQENYIIGSPIILAYSNEELGKYLRDSLNKTGQEIAFSAYKKEKEKIEFIAGTVIPIGEGKYVKFVDDNNKIKFIWCENNVLSEIGEIVSVHPPIEPRFINLDFGSINLFAEEIPNFTSTNDFVYVNYENGNITTKLAKKIVEDEYLVETIQLPTDAIVKKYLPRGIYEFDESGDIVDKNKKFSKSLDLVVKYSNPKISLPYKEGTYYVIPKNADWSKIDYFAKLSLDGKIEYIRKEMDETNPKDLELIFPLPKNSYVVDGTDLENIINKATKAEQQGNFKEALQIYDDEIKYHKDSPILFHNIGVLYFKLGDLDRAIAYLEDSLRQEPDYSLAVQANLNLGNVFLKKGGVWTDYAEKQFKKILEMNPNQVDALYSLGALEYNERKNQERAFQYWSRIREIENINQNGQQATSGKAERINPEKETKPKDFDKLYNEAVSEYEKKNYDSAIKNLESIIESAPQNYRNFTNSHLYLGNCFYLKEEYGKAISHLEKVALNNERRADIHCQLGYCYLIINNHSKSIEEYRKAVSINPLEKTYHYCLGNELLGIRNYDEAIREFREAIRIDSGYCDAYNNLGVAFEKQGLIQDAKKTYERALQIDSTHQNARDNLNRLNK